MNIYLLPHKKGKYLLYSKELQTESIKENVSESPQKQNKIIKRIKSGYKTATAKRERSEKLLKEMSALNEIVVYYPANLSEERAWEIYDDIIQSQIKKHKRWLIVNGALLPFSAILSIIPGPNILMVYLAWRTLAHYKTTKGGEKAISELEISFKGDPQLVILFEIVNKRFVFKRSAKISKIGADLEIEKLDKLY